MREPTLLIVDDEKPTRDGLRMALEDEFDCYVASDIREALNILKSDQIDLLLTDLRMAGDSGMDLLDQALALKSPPLAIMMTAYGSVDTAVEAMRRGAWDFITKPLNLDEVELLLKRALRTRSLEKTNQLLEKENQTLRVQSGQTPRGLDRLIGNSSAMQALRSHIKQIAATKSTVLIEGESGTGKELIAQAIHTLSGRPAEKLVTVNCAALSAQLLESELFGHEKGAFTGATQRRLGRFEQAHGGTLFLDEIGEIDAATQVKLLRALSERRIERVGSNTPIDVDVRVVAATNKQLRKLVDAGAFREDLYFRLNVLKLETTPLRARPEDLALLCHAFLEEFATENQRDLKPLTEQAFALLQHYPWPGNVRELRTAIEHGVVMSNAKSIHAEHLPRFLSRKDSSVQQSPEKEETEPIEAFEAKTLEPSLNFNLHQLEQNAIQRALLHCKDNRTEAAKLLGISRRTLQRKLKDLL